MTPTVEELAYAVLCLSGEGPSIEEIPHEVTQSQERAGRKERRAGRGRTLDVDCDLCGHQAFLKTGRLVPAML